MTTRSSENSPFPDGPRLRGAGVPQQPELMTVPGPHTLVPGWTLLATQGASPGAGPERGAGRATAVTAGPIPTGQRGSASGCVRRGGLRKPEAMFKVTAWKAPATAHSQSSAAAHRPCRVAHCTQAPYIHAYGTALCVCVHVNRLLEAIAGNWGQGWLPQGGEGRLSGDPSSSPGGCGTQATT